MKKDRKLIYHVYAGTQGSAGLYIDEIINAITDTNIKQKAFVSYYYPFSNGKKIFYKYTDLARGKRKNDIRLYIRYLELIYGLLYIVLECIFHRPNIVNYSLNTTYFPEIAFLYILKKVLNIRIILTCHDIIPFDNCYLNLSKEKQRRAFLFKLADYLLVHNINSKDDLFQYCNVPIKKVIYHSFPLMDLNHLVFQKNEIKSTDYLFVGHLRKEKGIDILLKAWELFHKEFPQLSLSVVGNLPNNNYIDIEKYEKMNINFILNYVDDNTYTNLISSSKCVILPYTRGTNSGIPSSVLLLNTCLIASQIPMFENNLLIDKKSLFTAGDPMSLFCKMKDLYIANFNVPRPDLQEYRDIFRKQVIDLYTNII